MRCCVSRAGVLRVCMEEVPSFLQVRTCTQGMHRVLHSEGGLGVGRAGRVFSLLRVEEVRHFKGLLRKVDNAYVKDHVLPKEALEAARPEVAHALDVLQAYLASQA